MTTITITCADGFELPALYVPSTQPNATPLVLIQEIFGINASLRLAAQQWAELGFDVVVPDLFARLEKDVQLDPAVPEQMQAGFKLMTQLNQDLAVQDLEAARQWLAKEKATDRVTTLGYCLGGRLAVRMALETPISAAVSYYGVGLNELLAKSQQPGSPCLLHIAEKDGFVPPPAREDILKFVDQRENFEAYVYEGCDHAFARPNGQHYVAAAADLAKERSVAFLKG